MTSTALFTPLVIPQSQVNSDRRPCPSDGFNYPNFRLVNKATRVYFSEPFDFQHGITYKPFAVANSKGWFAAARKIEHTHDIILSTLEELRQVIENASEDEKGLFLPQRDLTVEYGYPTILAFAHDETRLIVGLDVGSIFVYDTTSLFSSGSGYVHPIRTCDNHTAALRQIAPNPGSGPELRDTIAVVLSDGSVQLVNTMLELLGGWSPRDSPVGAVVVSWSPKGKHLAIGLQTGDILTFALNNKSTLSKHIPPAAEGRLVGLNWLSPGHSFRLTYAPQIENEGESVQQIVSLDAQSNLTVFGTTHPFTMSDRYQESHALILPHWDEDSASESKSLVVVGDRASVDLEILGGHNGQWYQQSQENPISLPLDRQTGETTLMGFDVDLTDLKAQTPILYAYLNDGSLQAWYLEHSKPYPKMVHTSNARQDSAMDEKAAADILLEFNQQYMSLPFSAPSSNAAFAPLLGEPSAFGHTPQPSLDGSSQFVSLSSDPSSFGHLASQSGMGTTISGNAFANIAAQHNNFFSTPDFGMATTFPSSHLALSSDEMMREASMLDGTMSGFGGLWSGDSNNNISTIKSNSSIYGTFAPTDQSPATSAFGGLIKPAQGFSAFSNSSLGSSTNGSQNAPTASTFSSLPYTHSAFGQANVEAKSAFGQPSFGQTGFGKPMIPATQSSGGLAAFASSSPSAFGSMASTAPSTGGFAAFATGGLSAFGSSPKQTQQATTNAFSSSPFNSNSEQARSPFASDENQPSSFEAGSSIFGNANNAPTSTSNFGFRENAGESTTPQSSQIREPPSGIVSPPSSPEPSGPGLSLDRKKAEPAPSAPAPGFLQQSSTGLGVLGSLQESSPFFKKLDAKTPAVTAFGDLTTGGAPRPPLSSTTPTTPSGFGAPSQPGLTKPQFASDPAFGVPSKLGVAKSAFAPTTATSTTPTKSPPTGGFDAFSAGASGFSALTGPKGSFSELLKETKESEESSSRGRQVKQGPSTPNKPISVFAQLTPKITTNPLETVVSATPPPSTVLKEESTTPKGPPPCEEREGALKAASVSSLGSFVDIAAEKSREGLDEEGDDTRSFLSSDFSSGPPTDDEVSDDETKGKGKAPVAPSQKKKSPSPTPQPEVPSAEVTSSSLVEVPNVAPMTEGSGETEESTTPAGSPSREIRVSSQSSSPTSVSVFSTPLTPPSHVIGFNRPDTRPARSSPLAGVPVSGTDEEEVQTQAENATRPSVEPKPILTRSSKQEDDASIAKRPGTPASLSSSEKPASVVSSVPKPELVKTQTPVALASSPPFEHVAPVSRPAESPIAPEQELSKPIPVPASGSIPAQAPILSDVPKPAPVKPTGSPFSQLPFPLVPKPPVFAQAGPSLFNAPPKPAAQTGQYQTGTEFLGVKPLETPNQTCSQAPTTKPTTSVSPPLASIEEGLQKECIIIVKSTEYELTKLNELSAKVAQSRNQLKEASGGSRLKADLGILEKWRISDASTFGQTLLQFEKDLVEMTDTQEASRQTLREVNCSLLKANTCREEIARFNKAKTDKEFAKMLSSRALAPEHLESQQHLRCSISLMRDRIQKLESHLERSKKRLSEVSSGKPSIRAPTLDVINRTYRNIDIVIQQQTDEITKLVNRVKELGCTESSPSRDVRPPDRRRSIMPQVAVTTAAALNAERSAYKLKNALLKVRKKPILNQRAALAPPPPETDAHQEPSTNPSHFGPGTGSLFTIPEGEPQTYIPDLNLPEDKFHPGSLLPSSRRGAGSVPRKHGSVSLKKTSRGTAQSSPSAIPAAEFWGSLPTFNNPPLNKFTEETKSTASFVPLSPVFPTSIPNMKGGPISSLPGGSFEAFMKPLS